MTEQERLRLLAGVKREWGKCVRCSLGKTAFIHILYQLPEGVTQPDVLFVGEAPGQREDTVGRPFCGKSGKFLRQVISEVSQQFNVTYGFTNLLACRPVNAVGNDRKPDKQEVESCSPRLVSLVRIMRPLVVVGLGRIPESLLPPILAQAGYTGPTAWFRQPAYLLRRGGRESPEFPEYLAQFEELFESIAEVKNANRLLPNEPAPDRSSELVIIARSGRQS